MEEQRNLKWIVVISLVMFFVSVWLGPSLFFTVPTYYPRIEVSTYEKVWYYINRLDVLLFIATITTGTLFNTGFGKKELLYKLAIYLFVISMGLFFLSFIKSLLTSPYP